MATQRRRTIIIFIDTAGTAVSDRGAVIVAIIIIKVEIRDERR
jgi:hypothetical protein